MSHLPKAQNVTVVVDVQNTEEPVVVEPVIVAEQEPVVGKERTVPPSIQQPSNQGQDVIVSSSSIAPETR